MAILVIWVVLTLCWTNQPARGQINGVSVSVQGAGVLNDGYIAFDIIGGAESPVFCHTDNPDCCSSKQAQPGHWFFPDDSTVGNVGSSGRAPFFARTRARNPGRVRLFRVDSSTAGPQERGRFFCEVPNAAGNLTQYYVNILNIGAIAISSPGPSSVTAGGSAILECTVDVSPNPLPKNVPSPTFEWFFGPTNTSLPAGVIMSDVINTSNNTYTSVLQFSPLRQTYAGLYTCRLGGNERLAVNTMITVNAPEISIVIIPMSERGSYTLSCNVSGYENLTVTMTYQWTKNNGTQKTQLGEDSSTLSFSPLKPSDCGQYTCKATVSSHYLSKDITFSTSHDVVFQFPTLSSLTIASDKPSPISPVGSSVALTCSVDLGPAMLGSDHSVTMEMIDVQLSRDGTPLNLTDPTVTGTSATYTIHIESFRRWDSGNYTCTATVGSNSPSSYLTGRSTLSSTLRITTGVYISLGRRSYHNNYSHISTADIGEGNDKALNCFTDLTQCCSDSDAPGQELGRWFYPNGSAVGLASDGEQFYIDRGPSVVSLYQRSYRINGMAPPTGQLCCEIPDATSMPTKICVTIHDVHVPSIDPESNEQVSTRVVITVGVAVAAICSIGCIIAVPIIVVMVTLCRRKKSSPIADPTAIYVDPARIYTLPTTDLAVIYSSPTADPDALLPTDESTTTVYSQMRTETEVEGRGGEDVYEDPDKLVSHSFPGSYRYKITQCPAYLTSTTPEGLSGTL